jgi:hypothetical protein
LEKVSSDPEAFYAASALPKVRELIAKVLEAEAPVHEEILARRILAAWGWTKLLPRAKKRVLDEARALETAKKLLFKDEFLWLPTQDPANLDHWRVPTDGVPRDADQIPLEEVARVCAWVLKQNLSLPKADLARETARLLGFARVGRGIADRVDQAAQLLAANGKCTIANDRVDVKE